jgi:chromosome segregation ATPase
MKTYTKSAKGTNLSVFKTAIRNAGTVLTQNIRDAFKFNRNIIPNKIQAVKIDTFTDNNYTNLKETIDIQNYQILKNDNQLQNASDVNDKYSIIPWINYQGRQTLITKVCNSDVKSLKVHLTVITEQEQIEENKDNDELNVSMLSNQSILDGNFLEQEINNLTLENQNKDQQIQNSQNMIAQLNQDKELLTQAKNNLTTQKTNLQTQVSTLENDKTNLQYQMQIKNEELQHANNERQAYTSRIQQLEGQNANLQYQTSSLSTQFDKLNIENSGLKNQKAKIEITLDLISGGIGDYNAYVSYKNLGNTKIDVIFKKELNRELIRTDTSAI